MDLNLHSVQAHMDMLMDAAYQWLKDKFNENENLRVRMANAAIGLYVLGNFFEIIDYQLFYLFKVA